MKIKKKYLSIIIILLYAIITGSVFILFENTNNIFVFFLHELLRSAWLPCASFLLLSILLEKIFNNKKFNLSLKKQMVIVLVCAFLISLIPINLNSFYDEYKIDNKKLYGLDMNVRIIKDIFNNETITIESDEIEVTKYLPNDFMSRSIRYDGSKKIYVYYIKINDGEYEIPIAEDNVTRSLLHPKDNEEGKINEIVVYKHSKLVKEINGVEVAEALKNR